jgi:hypothetical protein
VDRRTIPNPTNLDPWITALVLIGAAVVFLILGWWVPLIVMGIVAVVLVLALLGWVG